MGDGISTIPYRRVRVACSRATPGQRLRNNSTTSLSARTARRCHPPPHQSLLVAPYARHVLSHPRMACAGVLPRALSRVLGVGVLETLARGHRRRTAGVRAQRDQAIDTPTQLATTHAMVAPLCRMLGHCRNDSKSLVQWVSLELPGHIAATAKSVDSNRRPHRRLRCFVPCRMDVRMLPTHRGRPHRRTSKPLALASTHVPTLRGHPLTQLHGLDETHGTRNAQHDSESRVDPTQRSSNDGVG